MTIQSAVLFLAVILALSLNARARLGDSPLQTIARYGQPVASTGQPGALTSTRTFQVSGLTVTCGYVKNKVEMITYARDDRAFNPQEVEALLRTNGRKIGWKPGAGFGPGTYSRADGVTATVTDAKVEIKSPTWLEALAKDLGAVEKAVAKAVQPATPNAAKSSVTTP